MAELEIRYQPQGETLERFHLARDAFEFVMGPVGSGKTGAFVLKVLKLICEQPAVKIGVDSKNRPVMCRRSRWIITRNTYLDLADTTIRDWREIVPDSMGRFLNSKPPEHRLRFRLEDGTYVESDVIFLALDRPDHVKKLRGIQATGAWMNEAKEQPKAIFDMLTVRVGRHPRAADSPPYWSGVLGDYNAPDEDHWLFNLEQQWREGLLPDYAFFIQPGAVRKEGDHWIVNPNAENLHNLKEGYYERIIQGKSEAWIKVNIANQYGFVMDGKPVHPQYNDEIHCAKEILLPVPGGEVIVGLDFGLTPAAAFLQRNSVGRWIAFDEVVCEDMGAERFAEELHAKMAEYEKFKLSYTFRGDPSGDERAETDEESAFRVLRTNKIPAMPASTNDAALRRSALERPLMRMITGKPGILISPKCKILRKGLAGGFCYKRVQVASDERFRDVPDKNKFSHVVEACEYALLEGGEKATLPKPGSQTPTKTIRFSGGGRPFDPHNPFGR